MNVINSLTRIKIFREDKAEREVTRSRLAVQDAETALSQANAAMAEYRAFIQRREAALYTDLFSKLVIRRDLDDLALELNGMKEKMSEYQEHVNSAQTVVTSAMENLDCAKEEYRIAMKTREKFTELGLRLSEEESTVSNMLEDGELEEVSSSTFGRRLRSDDEFSGMMQ
jgi:flagellar biosynthesis chaperone FliJ